VHRKQQTQNELADLYHSFLALLELHLLNDFRKARYACHLEDLKQGQRGHGINSRPRYRSDQVDEEHAANVARGYLFPVADLLALHAEVSRPELHENVDEEGDVGEVAKSFVLRVGVERDQHKLEAYGEGGDDSEHQDKHVPDLLPLAHVIYDRDPTFLYDTENWLGQTAGWGGDLPMTSDAR